MENNKPVPAPESRLLSKEEITACYKRTKFPHPAAIEREICIAQRDLTSALVRAECQEEIKELKEDLDYYKNSVSEVVEQRNQLQATHKKELERVFKGIDKRGLFQDHINSCYGEAHPNPSQCNACWYTALKKSVEGK